jgi:hypothetical protein
MEIRILEEAGHALAVTGMKFSHEVESPLKDIEEVTYADTKSTRTLAAKDKGHNKFLESCMVWFDMRAPLYFWKQFDTYRVGVTKQSKSTMHSLMKRPISHRDFEIGCNLMYLEHLNEKRSKGQFEMLINDLPDGYIQTRRVCCSYKVIRHIIMQRQGHKLEEWNFFCEHMISKLKYPRLLGGDLVQDGLR